MQRSRKPIPRRNATRVAKKRKVYAKHLGSAYWQKLRRKAFERDGGLCQCPECITGRKNGEADAYEPIPIWFDTKGGIHGFDLHHRSYVRFGKELLSDVLTLHPLHHRALEATTGFRNAFLRGK